MKIPGFFNKQKVDAKTDASAKKPIGIASQTLARILTAYGRHSIDMTDKPATQTELAFSAWAAHVLKGGPPPIKDERKDTNLRYWKGLIAYFEKHRQEESLYVTTSMKDLRELIWIFFKLLSIDISRNRICDQKLTKQLAYLKKAVEGPAIDDLKTAALETVKVIGELTQENQASQQKQLKQLGDQLRKLRQALNDAKKQLEIDPLTRLYNRKAMDEHLGRLTDISMFSGKPACLMMVDIDHFKSVNDTHGHLVGDAVLSGVAKAMIEMFPRKNDFIARYGGEEFSVILEEDDIEIAKVLGEKLRAMVEKNSFTYESKVITITVSIGIAEFIPGESANEFIERADQALYRAKHNGRNQICLAK
jgi:diguanylate cyclase (GGDEF)-like protein